MPGSGGWGYKQRPQQMLKQEARTRPDNLQTDNPPHCLGEVLPPPQGLPPCLKGGSHCATIMPCRALSTPASQGKGLASHTGSSSSQTTAGGGKPGLPGSFSKPA